MIVHILSKVVKSAYYDSVVLMRVAARLRAMPGVEDAALFMGTDANHELLAQAGLSTPQSREAGPRDLVISVRAVNEREAEAGVAASGEMLSESRAASADLGEYSPRTLEAALKSMPDANLAVVSVPGVHARREAMKALRSGLHVFLFSDNVPEEQEAELKSEAVSRGLLCMGPDCGTAWLGGLGIGFANVVPRGRIGLVSASGTGMQAVACELAALGEGISQGIGVGGRDLSRMQGGAMTLFALEALAADPGTEVVVLISKPPHESVLPRLEAALAALGKPAVVCCLGAKPGKSALWAPTLDAAARAAVALARGQAFDSNDAEPSDAGRLEKLSGRGPSGGRLIGLFTGGTLAYEAALVLDPALGTVGHGLPWESAGHTVVDLGDDRFTQGRPHPMIEPSIRTETLARCMTSPEDAVFLFDVLLGSASHPDPSGELVRGWIAARAAAEAAGKRVVALASMTGTPDDPQGFAAQVAALEEAGIEVFTSNSRAARFAALLLGRETAGAVAGGNK